MKDVESVLSCPALLVPFHLLCYANLKKYVFDHHFSFPSLSSKWTIQETKTVDEEIVRKVEEYISNAPAEQRGFFVITEHGTVEPLSHLSSNKKVLPFGVFVVVNMSRLHWGIYLHPPLPKQNPNPSKTFLHSSISIPFSRNPEYKSSPTVVTPLPTSSSSTPRNSPRVQLALALGGSYMPVGRKISRVRGLRDDMIYRP